MWQCWEVSGDVCAMMGRWVEALTVETVWCHSRKTLGGAAASLQNKAALVSRHQKGWVWMLVCSATCFTRYNESLFTNQEGKRAPGDICNTQCWVSALNRVFPGRRGGTWDKQDAGNGPASKKGQSRDPCTIMDTILLLFRVGSRYSGCSRMFFSNVWYRIVNSGLHICSVEMKASDPLQGCVTCFMCCCDW